jgi:hypothetical protein
MKHFRLAVTWMLLLVSIACGNAASPACSPADIKIKQADWHRVQTLGNGLLQVQILGEITNSCTIPASAQMAATFRDEKGAVVAVKEFWPTRQPISPGESYPFEAGYFLSNAGALSTMSLRVINVQ